jgi:hypothetical protein
MKPQMLNYGPWSTSLDAGFRLQLSAFWKRRMLSLASLPLGSQPLSRRCVTAALATVLLLAAAPLLQWSTAAADDSSKEKAAEKDDRSAKPGNDHKADYGKVIERTVNDNGHGEYLIDLDSGALFERPDDRRFASERDFQAWARSQGIDAMGQVSSGYKGLYGFDMIVVPSDAASWDQRPGGVLESLAVGDPGTPAIMDARVGLPATYFIQTREGARGVLQIVGIAEDDDQPGPDQVKVRYRLIAADGDEPGTAPGRQLNTDKDAGFIARFSTGAEVELLGIAENPSEGTKWWRPDGTPLAKPPYVNSAPRMIGELSRELCWRWRGADDPEIKLGWDVRGPLTSGWAPARPRDARGGELKQLTAYAVPMEEAESCEVHFSIDRPISAWMEYRTDNAGNASAFVSHAPGMPVNGVTFSRPRDIEGGTLVTIGYVLPRNHEVRLKAVDKGGQKHLGKGEFAGGMLEFRQLMVQFNGVKAKDIDTWIVEARERSTETMVFKNVSLHPGRMTAPEVVRQKAAPREQSDYSR